MRFLILPVILMSLAGCSEGLKPVEAASPEAAAPVEAPVAPDPADLPPLAAILSETAPAAGLAIGGSIDVVSADSATGMVTVYGWVLVRSGEPAPELNVYAPGALSAGPVTRVIRDDVSTALNDVDLRFSGFDLKIEAAPDMALTDLCITANDSVYGQTLLVAQPGAAPGCSLQAAAEAAAE